MRLFIVTCILGIFLGVGAGLSEAGGPSGDGWDSPQQQMAPQTKVVVVQPDNDNTAIYVVGGMTLLGTLGAAAIGVRRNRKG
jgi:hypothetical protein